MKKFLPKSAKNPQGFTLVELLVVISIIAILAVIGLAVFSGVQKNARDSKRKADIDAIGKAWEAHYQNTGSRYPALLETWFAGSSYPRDPQTGLAYTYTGGANETTPANTYNVCATLEAGGTYCRVNQQ